MTAPPSRTGKEMNERETRSFLASNEHGVLSLGVENRGYGFPISYSYDEEYDEIVLGFVSPPESKKRKFAAATEEATFTVYAYEDVDTWTSVIATGPIRSVDGDDSSYSVPDLFFRMEDEPGEERLANLDEFDRRWYELRIETLSGRRSGE